MLVVVGLNQRSATVADREALAIPADELEAALASHASLDGIDELVVLSTCYRVEIYAAAHPPAAAMLALRRALCGRGGRELPTFELQGEEAFRHLVRVAASLESAILGEPQILGQVKDAFARAIEGGFAGRELTGVMNRALAAAKRVRTETAVGRAGVSWGHATAALAEKVIGPLAGRRVVIVGAGEMARLTAQHLRDERADLVILNRTVAHAHALAIEVGARFGGLASLDAELEDADVVVSAAPVSPEAFAPAAMAARMRRRGRRLVMVDLAVPRAIPAAVGELGDVYLCDVDDLDRVMRASLAERAAAAAQAEGIVEKEVAGFVRAAAERMVAPLIAELRTRASRLAREEVERTLRRLGEDPEIERRLDALAGAIVAKLLHAPSTRLRAAVSAGGTGEALVAAAVEIFDLRAAAGAERGRAELG